MIAAAPRHGPDRSARRRRHATRCRPGSKTGLESEGGNAIATRTEAVSASAPTCRSKAAAIAPNSPRALRRRPGRTRRIPGPNRTGRSSPPARNLNSRSTKAHGERFRRARPPVPRLARAHRARWDQDVDLVEGTGARDSASLGAGRSSASLTATNRRAAVARGFRPVEPFDPDLPPSRTQRRRARPAPARPGEIEGQDRGRHRVPPSLEPPVDEWPRTGPGPESRRSSPRQATSPEGAEDADARRRRPRSRSGRRPADPEASLIPEIEPGAGPDDFVDGPGFERLAAAR